MSGKGWVMRATALCCTVACLAITYGCWSRPFTEMTVISPNGSETLYYEGRDTEVAWTTDAGSGNVDIYYTTGGGSWNEVVLNAPNTGSYLWAVPNDDSSLCRVRVQQSGSPGVSDQSDANFTIAQLPGTMIGHWKLDETSGDKAADSSGNLNEGTLAGFTFGTGAATGKIGGGLEFDGSGCYVELFDNNLASPVTFCFWMKMPSFGMLDVMSGYLEFDPDRWSIQFDLFGAAKVCWGEHATVNYVSSNTGLSLNTWYHIAVIHNLGSGTVTFYLNGAPDGSGSVSRDLDTPSKLRLIGPAGNFRCILDDVRIYGRVLSDTDIQALNDAGRQ